MEKLINILKENEALKTKFVCNVCQVNDGTLKQYCKCYYHLDCLKKLVNDKQKSTCPTCEQTFTGCKIVKKPRPLREFLLSFETCFTFAITTFIFIYCLQFFTMVFTEYELTYQIVPNSAILRLFILIPGISYLFICFVNMGISIIFIMIKYQEWKSHHYTLMIE